MEQVEVTALDDNEKKTFFGKLKSVFMKNKNLIIAILIPLVFSIIPIAWQSEPKAAFCCFVILLMSVYWIFECVPVAITGILPVFLYPFAGIMKSEEITPIYFRDILMFIYGSVIISNAIETTGLHEKLAIKFCMLIGSNPAWILLGILSISGFLSLWISNAAVASMILPVTVSITKQLVLLDNARNENKEAEMEAENARRASATMPFRARSRAKSRNAIHDIATIVELEDLGDKLPEENFLNTVEELNQQLKTEYSNLSNPYRRSSQGHEREISYADLYESRKARRASYADIRVDYMHARHLHHHSRHQSQHELRTPTGMQRDETLHTRNDSYADVRSIKSQESVESESNAEIFKTKESIELLKGFCLSITYGACVGGTGSIIGTVPNLLFKDYIDANYSEVGVSFLTFMAFSLPLSVIMTLITWVVIGVIWLPKGKFFKSLIGSFKRKPKNEASKEDPLKKMMKEKYEKLGPFTWEQGSIAVIFLILIVLWIFRDPNVFPGWNVLFKDDSVTTTTTTASYVTNMDTTISPSKNEEKFASRITKDTTVTMLFLFLTVVWPKRNIFRGEEYEPLISWDTIKEMFPWSIIFLIDYYFHQKKYSKLDKLILSLFQKIISRQKELAVFEIGIVAQIATEFLSNVSIISIFQGVVDQLAISYNIYPIYLLLPLAISVGYGVILPVASPSNAILYTSGYLTIKDMILTGVIIKMIGTLVLILTSFSYLALLFPEKTLSPGNSRMNFIIANSNHSYFSN